MFSKDLKHRLCRTCLITLSNNQALVTFPIFNSEDLAKKLMLCSSLTMESNDEYPQQVCLECYNKILQFYEFQQMCCRSLDKFKELLEYAGEVKKEYDVGPTAENNPLNKDKKLDYVSEKEQLIDVSLYTNSLEDKSCITTPMKTKLRRLPQKKKVLEKKKKATIAKRSCRNIKKKHLNPTVFENGIVTNPPENITTECKSEIMSKKTHSKKKVIKPEFTQANLETEPTEKLDKNLKTGDKLKSNMLEEEITCSDSESNSTDHKTKATKSRAYKCDRCEESFYYQYRLEAHKRQHDGLAPYPCTFEGCERTFKRWPYFKEHIKDHNGNQELQYKCGVDNCERFYKSRSNLNIHKRKYHHLGPELKSHMCELCGKVFKTSTILNDHRYTHIDRTQFPYVCDDETGCTKRFSTKLKLKIHKMRHAGIKNFICPYCGMRKTTRNELKIHINYHTLERTWACQFCSKVFNSAGNLKGHVKNMHERAKDFACSFCGRTFAKADTKKHHEMTHTGEKPQVCEICGRRFIQPAALRTHKKIHLKQKSKIVTGECEDAKLSNELEDSENVQPIVAATEAMLADILSDNKSNID